MKLIDLRSDTVTRPTHAMREVIAHAEVGDDALGDDPSVNALEARVAELLGKESALFFPTGVMANEAAIAIHAPRGEEVVVEATSHFVDWELGAPAALNGVTMRTVAAPGGLLTPELVEAAIRPRGLLQLRTSLICLENTHSASGGRILPLETARAIADVAHRHGVPVYLDGSRLWNAAVATGHAEADFAACADTVMVGLSKGLGCPVGSVLAGSEGRITEARRARRRMGGAMRQAGILAAAGLYAIDHHRDRLTDDHRRARRLAELTARTPGLEAIPPETNILMFDIRRPGLDAAALVQRLARDNVLLAEFTTTRVRAVTHLDVDDADIERAAAVINHVMSN
jgi:threonine aldolase